MALAGEVMGVSVERFNGVTVLAVGGEMDLATTPVFSTAIAQILADGPVPLVIDLSGVKLLSSAALALLVEVRDKVRGVAPLAIVASAQAKRVTRLLGSPTPLSVQPTLQDALTAVGNPQRRT